MTSREKRANAGIVEARVPLTTIATIYTYFKNNGVGFRSKSALVRETIESFEELVIKASPTSEVKDEAEAVKVLTQSGLFPDMFKRGGKTALLEKLREQMDSGGDVNSAKAVPGLLKKLEKAKAKTKAKVEGNEDEDNS